MHLSKKDSIILFILGVIAALRFFFFIPEPQAYDDALDRRVEVEGIVVDAPDIRLTYQNITVQPLHQESNILVTTSRNDTIVYGDHVRVEGILQKPENFITSSGKEFNYRRYLAYRDIYFIIKNGTVTVLSHGHGSSLQGPLYALRDSFMKNIRSVLMPPESDLASGLILGVRGGFDAETRDEFITTGTIHIVALSGYNVTIVAEGAMKLLGYVFTTVVSAICGIGVIILFILLSGASSTAVRAGVMAVIALFARVTGRRYDAGRALVVAAALMIAYDPRVLGDISFQLSFVATFGVLFVTPKIVRFVNYIPQTLGLRELVATTIAATITVLPLILYATGILSLVSLPANILILPVIPLAMLLGFIVGALGYISSLIVLPFAYGAHLVLSYIFSVIHFFASLSYASITIQTFPLLLVIGIYGLIFWWVFRKH